MNYCTIHFEYKKHKPPITCPGKIIKDGDEKVIHPFKHEVSAINFDSSSMSGRVLAEGSLFRNAEIHGYRDWSTEWEISINLIKVDRNGKNSPEYSVNFNGYIQLYHTINSIEHTLDLEINGTYENKLIINENNVDVETDYGVYSDIDISGDELGLTGNVINLSFSKPIESVKIDGNKRDDFVHLIKS